MTIQSNFQQIYIQRYPNWDNHNDTNCEKWIEHILTSYDFLLRMCSNWLQHDLMRIKQLFVLIDLWKLVAHNEQRGIYREKLSVFFKYPSCVISSSLQTYMYLSFLTKTSWIISLISYFEYLLLLKKIVMMYLSYDTSNTVCSHLSKWYKPIVTWHIAKIPQHFWCNIGIII